jgi:hypothetical protein
MGQLQTAQDGFAPACHAEKSTVGGIHVKSELLVSGAI